VTAPQDVALRHATRALWIVLGVALLVRLAGIFGQGWPHCFYPDETNAIQRALRFGAERTANPGWFNKPALAYYLWFLAYGCFYAIGRLFGAFGSAEQFGVWAIDRVGPFLVIGRVVSTLFGVATVWLTYLLGRAVRDRTVGIVAALALTLTYGHVVTGQWVKEDVPCGFFHTAATVLLVGAFQNARGKDALRAGLLGGLGMATKYYSIGLMIPAAFAHLFPPREAGRPVPKRLAFVGLFLVAFAGGFFVGSPYNFLDPGFWNDHVAPGLKRVGSLLGLGWAFAAIGTQVQRGVFVDTAGLSLVDTLHAVVESLWVPRGLGGAFFVLAAGGAVLAVARRRRTDAFMLVATLGQAVFIAVTNRQASEPRHLVALYPLLAVWVAESCVFVAGAIRRVLPRASRAALGAAVLVALACVPLGGPSVARMLVDRSLEPWRGDTRVAALTWIEANLPAGSGIVNDHEVVPLRPGTERCQWAIDRLRGRGGGDVWTRLRRWQFRKSAAADAWRPAYDVLVFEAGWGAESREGLELHRSLYDTTWPGENDIVRRPAEVPPVARYAEVPEAARRLLDSRPVRSVQLERAWPASKWLVNGRPVEWLVSSEVTYNNYEKPAKREAYPARAAFYDDLKAHYDCYQWSAGRGSRTGPTVRLWDLRTRVSRPPIVREMNGDG
jgi:4-amino-4-deoxy-L-arabinose transferase-like glycosyltransferase